MKRLFMLCILIFAILPARAFSQTSIVQKSDKEIISLLCHKWQLTHMETKGKEYALPPGTVSGLLIKSDGTLIETDQGKEYPGKWTLSHGVLSVTNDGKGPVEKYKITKITNAELIYETNEDGTTTKIKMKRVS